MATWRREAATGRWAGILPALGISSSSLTGRHVGCPLCVDGGGKDRFRFDDKDGNGTWICNRCGSGDGLGLVMRKNGWSFREAADRVNAMVGAVEPSTPRPTMSEDDLRRALRRLWCDTGAVSVNSAAGRWLRRRTGVVAFPEALRSIARMRYHASPATFHPGMVALVSAADGRPCTLHRTYLTADGQKARVEAVRRLMPGHVARGASVRLSPPAEELGIAEGIETALSASAMFSVPCWSALNARLLQDWLPPSEARRVIVFGDNDESWTGQEAAYALAKRLAAKGLAVDVQIPPNAGDDWNDVHMRELEAA